MDITHITEQLMKLDARDKIAVARRILDNLEGSDTNQVYQGLPNLDRVDSLETSQQEDSAVSYCSFMEPQPESRNKFEKLQLDLRGLISSHLSEHKDVLSKLDENIIDTINVISAKVSKCLSLGGTIFWCGNGGSAADSQHLAAELVGRFKKDRAPLRSVALTTDTSVLTCISNDYNYETVFSRQIEALARHGDVLIGISTSGQSKNILRAFHSANSMGVNTIGLLGKDGGSIVTVAAESLIVPSESTARIQEIHILVGHIICDFVESNLLV